MLLLRHQALRACIGAGDCHQVLASKPQIVAGLLTQGAQGQQLCSSTQDNRNKRGMPAQLPSLENCLKATQSHATYASRQDVVRALANLRERVREETQQRGPLSELEVQNVHEAMERLRHAWHVKALQTMALAVGIVVSGAAGVAAVFGYR
mmetsp:Transcript_22692/g.62649  ORF Transcript_22692/g.62649 Transcript_22692/m.62649 type:complete len:151 (+) Transcript_22692:99-551(+)